MQSVKNLFKQDNIHQVVVVSILMMYILLDVKTPDSLAELVDTIYGQIIVLLGALTIFTTFHPIVGVLALYAAYVLITRSSESTGTYAINHIMPSEDKKYDEMIESNNIPHTLEEEVVTNMVPVVRDVATGDPSYSPVLDSSIDGSFL